MRERGRGKETIERSRMVWYRNWLSVDAHSEVSAEPWYMYIYPIERLSAHSSIIQLLVRLHGAYTTCGRAIPPLYLRYHLSGLLGRNTKCI